MDKTSIQFYSPYALHALTFTANINTFHTLLIFTSIFCCVFPHTVGFAFCENPTKALLIDWLIEYFHSVADDSKWYNVLVS